MSKFRPQIGSYNRIPTSKSNGLQLQTEVEELRALSGMDGDPKPAAPEKRRVNWPALFNLAITLACLVLLAITIARLNTVEAAARAAEAAAKTTGLAMRDLESRIAQRERNVSTTQPPDAPVRKEPAQSPGKLRHPRPPSTSR